MEALGIDIGGTGIKAAIVDTRTGALRTERARFPTPVPSTPERVAEVVKEAIVRFEYAGPVGCGFPGVVREGAVLTAANVSKKWVGVNAEGLFKRTTGLPFFMANDADLAGVAEMRFGAGRRKKGLVIMLTFGTGIGTAFFIDGKLVPNTELGHLEIGGREAEKWASERARIKHGLSWKRWASRVNAYLERLHAYFWPELFILGGGASKKFDEFDRYLSAPCDIIPAKLRNRAGVIGASLLAVKGHRI